MQMCERQIDYFAVSAHDFWPAFAVSLLDRLLDVRDRFLARQNARDAEEARLHNRIDASAHPDLLREGVSVDGIETDALIDHLLLHLARQTIPDLRRVSGCIQQKH